MHTSLKHTKTYSSCPGSSKGGHNSEGRGPKTWCNCLQQSTVHTSVPDTGCSDRSSCAGSGQMGTARRKLHSQGFRLDCTEVFKGLPALPPLCTRDVTSFFSCCWETNPPLLFLARFKSLTVIRRIQVKTTGVTQSLDTLAGDVFLQCKAA